MRHVYHDKGGWPDWVSVGVQEMGLVPHRHPKLQQEAACTALPGWKEDPRMLQRKKDAQGSASSKCTGYVVRSGIWRRFRGQ